MLYITLYYIILCYVMLCYVILYYILHYVILYYIILYYILYYIILHYIILCYVMLYYIIYYIILYYIILYITLCYICYIIQQPRVLRPLQRRRASSLTSPCSPPRLSSRSHRNTGCARRFIWLHSRVRLLVCPLAHTETRAVHVGSFGFIPVFASSSVLSLTQKHGLCT